MTEIMLMKQLENFEDLVRDIYVMLEKSDLQPVFSVLYSLEIDRLIRRELGVSYGIIYSANEICSESTEKLKNNKLLILNKKCNPVLKIKNVISKAEEIAREGDIAKALTYAYTHAYESEVRSLSIFHANYKSVNNNARIYFLNKYLALFNKEIGLESNERKDFFYRLKSIKKYNNISGPLITVLMPVFNVEKTIEIAINSILNQSLESLQLIIIDDCSTDSTLDICMNYTKIDKRVQVFSMKNNVGPYACRNLGVIHALGEFITVHDGDDFAFPDRLELQLNALMKSNAHACTGGMLRMNLKGKITRSAPLGKMSSDGYLRLCFVSLMVSSEVFHERLGGWDFVRVGGDAEMLDRIKKLNIVQVHIDQPLMICLDGEGGLTNDADFGLLNDIRREYANAYKKWHDGQVVEVIDVRSVSRYFDAPISNVVNQPIVLESYRANGVI